MPSPFPGMNPYLEHPDVWPDFHLRYIAAIAEGLNPLLGEGYFAKVELHVFLHELPDERPRLIARGDAGIVDTGWRGAAPGDNTQLAPVLGRIHLAVDKVRVAYVEIFDSQSRQIVTVIELLSPTNKRAGSDREQYLGKRQRLLRSDANFVEIDLLRGWQRMPVEDLPTCDYCVMVSRRDTRPNVDLWPIMLRERLPTIPIPLKADRQVMLDLQPLVHKVFDAAGYEKYVYEANPYPLLSRPDATWAQQQLGVI